MINKNTLKIIILAIVILSILSCQKEVEELARPFVTVRTLPATNVSTTGVTFNGEILKLNGQNIIDYGFIWSNSFRPLILETPSLAINSISLGNNPPENIFSVILTIGQQLNRSQVYFVRAYVTIDGLSTYGNEISVRPR